MNGTKTTKQVLPLPLWMIGCFGILVGAVMGIDGPAHAKNTAQAVDPKEQTSTDSLGEEANLAPPVTVIEAPETGTETNAAEATPVPPRRTAKEKIVYSDSPEEKKAGGLGIRNILALLLLVCVAGGAMFFAKRKQKAGGPLKQSRAMSLVDTMRMGGRHSISLVQVPGRLLVVATTDKGMTLLTDMSSEGPLGAPELTEAPGFRPKPSNDEGLVRNENEEFFNHLMHRINNSPTGAESPEAPIAQEYAGTSSLRNRLQQYQLGPTNA